jgi:hypothetical protein
MVAAGLVGARYRCGVPQVLRRVAGRAGRIERPLLVLLALAVAQTMAWSVLLPPWQGADEISHFAYVQRMVETQSVPWFPGGNPGDPRASYSTEADVAARWGGTLQVLLNPSGRPPGSPVAERLWREADAPLTQKDRANGGYSSAMAYPPLYYLYDAIPYAATSWLSIFDRAFAMRAFNLPLVVAIVWLTWLIAGELLGRRRWLQTLATAAVALNPQLMQLGAVVNPDILLSAEWIAFFYLAIMAIRHGPTRGRLLGMVALCVASGLTHGRGLPIVVPAALVGVSLLIRYRRPSRRVLIGGAIAAAPLAAAAFYGALVYATFGELSSLRLRQFGSYLWQFYLPKLGFMDPAIGPLWHARQVFIDRFYGTYGGLDVVFTPGALNLLNDLSMAAILLALVGLLTRWQSVRRWPDIVALFALGAAAYLFFMHLAAFRSLVSGGGDPVLTGRYLLPFMPVYGMAIALAVGWLPRRVAPVAAGAVVGGLCLLPIGAFGFALARYYA